MRAALSPNKHSGSTDSLPGLIMLTVGSESLLGTIVPK